MKMSRDAALLILAEREFQRVEAEAEALKGLSSHHFTPNGTDTIQREVYVKIRAQTSVSKRVSFTLV